MKTKQHGSGIGAMYLALSYDHRLLDGKEAVAFLIAIKDQLESPEKLLLNL